MGGRPFPLASDVVAIAALASAVIVLAGCGSGTPESAPTTSDVGPAARAWLASLPEEPAIWEACPPEGEDRAAWEDAFLGGWERLAAADAPPDAAAGAWRAFIEAGTVWAAAVIAGVDEPAMFEGVRDAEARLVTEVEEWVGLSELEESLALSPDVTSVCD